MVIESVVNTSVVDSIVVVFDDSDVVSPCAPEVNVISVVDMNVVAALVVSSSILGVVDSVSAVVVSDFSVVDKVVGDHVDVSLPVVVAVVEVNILVVVSAV